DRDRVRHSRRPRLCRRLRARHDARRRRGGAGRAHQPGALPAGRRSAAALLHRGHHRRPGLVARHSRRRAAHWPVGRHRLGLLFPHPCQDHRHAGGCAGAGVPAAGPVWAGHAMKPQTRTLVLHLGVLALLFALQFVLPAYHHGIMARIMVLAVFAMGYNLLFGYTGLLSLGHAMFFSAGLYGAGLTVYHLGWSVPAALAAGLAAGVALSALVGLLALRTSGVAFMIVTMMFGQVFYLLTLQFGDWTRGEEGLTLAASLRVLGPLDLTNPTTRYFAALALFAIVLLATLKVVRAPFGRVLVAIRENEERTRMLGYDTFLNKLGATILSGTICAAAGAVYALLFGYFGSTFATV